MRRGSRVRPYPVGQSEIFGKEEDMRTAWLLGVAVCLAGLPAMAQDPVKVDPNNWKVEFENAQVRVLRVHIPAHGKLGMHEHPASVLIPLTDGHVKDILPDGK